MKEFCTREVTSILDKIPIVKNLARKKFVFMFVVAMIKTRAVQFCEIAQALNDNVKVSSNEVRIQDFFREVPMDYEQVALLLAMFLPRRGKVTLCIDRTEWDFGLCQVNILMIVVRCKDITIPLYFELLDNKSGNSNTDNRIDLLKKCIDLLGAERIGLFLGDREFIGHRWLKFLKDKSIPFCVRVPKHHKITRYCGIEERRQTIEAILGQRKTIRISGCMVDGIWGNVYAKRLKDGDLLFLFGTTKVEYLAQFYKKRWCIAPIAIGVFQNIKGRGFDLESTHLKDLAKLKKLVALVCIAHAFVANMGLHHHRKVEPIPVKNHGYKANSFSRKGINIVRDGLRKRWRICTERFTEFIIKFLRWIHLNPNNFHLPEF